MDLGNALGNGAAVVALGASAIGAWRFASRLYRRTLGSRGDLGRKLDRLACGVPLSYVEQLFGSPTFVRNLPTQPDAIERIYRTPHAWLRLWFGEDSSVRLISITTTDPKFRYRTRWLTFDQLNAMLGKSTFSDVTAPPSGVRLEVATRRYEYAESFYFGNPGNYAPYALSHSMSGCGSMNLNEAAAIGYWLSGDLASRAGNEAAVPTRSAPPDGVRQTTTINTLTVGAPDMAINEIAMDWIGVDHDLVRTLRVF